MKILTNDLSKKSPYVIDESTYDLHEYTASISQYNITRKGLYMFDKIGPYVYGVYTVIIDGVTYEQTEQIAFGNFNNIEFINGSNIKVRNNLTELTVTYSHIYSKIRISLSSATRFRVIGKYY